MPRALMQTRFALVDKKSMPPLVPPIRLDATRRPWAAAVQRLLTSVAGAPTCADWYEAVGRLGDRRLRQRRLYEYCGRKALARRSVQRR
jgi:hypothetical protein